MPLFSEPTTVPFDPIYTGVADTGLAQSINHVTEGLPVPEPSTAWLILLILVIWLICFETKRPKII